jgi:predicted hydrocarbon binding protein
MTKLASKKLSKKKTSKSTAKKVVIKKTKAKRAETKPKAKSTTRPKRTATTEAPTLIKKAFKRADLITHAITEQHEHPSKFDESYKSVYEISGIGGNTYVKFYKAGIRIVEDFVNAGLKKISETLGWTERGGLPLFLRALSLQTWIVENYCKNQR